MTGVQTCALPISILDTAALAAVAAAKSSYNIGRYFTKFVHIFKGSINMRKKI